MLKVWPALSPDHFLIRRTEFRLYKWLRANTYDRLAFGEHVSNRNEFEALVWKQWEDAEAAIRSYLMDTPCEFFCP
jgi:hypothetical protein